MGVSARPFFGPAALVVPAFADGLGPGVRHEVIVDVVDAAGDRVGRQHRRGERRPRLQRVGGVGDRGQPGPQGAQSRQRRQPGERPGRFGAQVLELLDRGRAERDAGADTPTAAPRRRSGRPA